MRVSSDLSEVKSFEALPKDIYRVRIDSIAAKKGKNEPHNPYLELTWIVEGGEYDGRKIMYDMVSVGGISREKKPIIPFRLAELLEAAEIPWTCKVCNPGEGNVNDRVAKFIRGNGENGFDKGYLFCPDCHQKAATDYDTENFPGKRCNAAVDIEKQEGTDKEKNVIKRYAPII